MHVIFRTDASETIGSGHLMRCLLLAEAILEIGGRCRFIIGNRNIVSNRLLENCSHDVFFLNLPEVVDRAEDARHCIQYMQTLPSVDWVIVDHYNIDRQWEYLIKSITKRILVIDDLANRTHECDVLLDSGYGRQVKDYESLIPQKTKQLLGSQFAILQSSFANAHASAPQWPDVKRVHIFLGGGDAARWLSDCIELVMDIEQSAEILAIGYGNEQVMARLQKRFGTKLEWRGYEKEMVKHYARCSLAIGSPGTATWERACIGIPSALIATAENQIPILTQLDQLGLCRYLGTVSQLGSKDLRDKIRAFFQDEQSRLSMKRTGLAAVDGKGIKRIMLNLLENKHFDV